MPDILNSKMLKAYPAITKVLNALPAASREDILMDDEAGENVLAAETILGTAYNHKIELDADFVQELKSYMDADPQAKDDEKAKLIKHVHQYWPNVKQ